MKFREAMELEVCNTVGDLDVDLWNESLTSVMWSAAAEAIPKKKINQKEIKAQNQDKLEFNNDNTGYINLLLSSDELKRAIKQGKDTSPGRDGLSHQMFKQAGEMLVEELLSLCNKLWTDGCLLRQWKNATINPVVKPGESPCDPSSYGPVALISVVFKIMEQMVTHRPVQKLEENKYFVLYQSGFRQGRSTMDAVLKLDQYK